MTKQTQPDLFGCTDPQGSLFASEPENSHWKPNPDKVRRRLNRILAEARAAGSMPWDWSQRSLYETIFPQMAGLLPEGEAAQYRFDFEREMDRLKAA